jgi:hypothetical protein
VVLPPSPRAGSGLLEADSRAKGHLRAALRKRLQAHQPWRGCLPSRAKVTLTPPARLPRDPSNAYCVCVRHQRRHQRPAASALDGMASLAEP